MSDYNPDHPDSIRLAGDAEAAGYEDGLVYNAKFWSEPQWRDRWRGTPHWPYYERGYRRGQADADR